MLVSDEPDARDSYSEVVVVGRLGARVDTRELPSGDEVTVFTVVVDRPRRERGTIRGASVDSIACQSFRVAVTRSLGRLSVGDRIRVEGTLHRRFWRSGAGLGSAMEVDVRRIRRVRG
jgi:single-strand DNA-binding protein